MSLHKTIKMASKYDMDVNRLIQWTKELNKNGYKLTMFGVRKETDPTPCSSIYLDDKCIEYNKIIDEKIKDGTFKIDERKNPTKKLWTCYGFKHKLEKINNGKYLTEGQIIAIMAMKGLLRDYKQYDDCIILLKLI